MFYSKKNQDLNFSPIPDRLFYDSEADLELEVRVVYNRSILQEIYNPKKAFSIGNSKECDYEIDAALLKIDSFTLVSDGKTAAELNIRKDFEGYIIDNGVKIELKTLIQQGEKKFLITRNSFAVLNFGYLEIVILFTPKEVLRRYPFFFSTDCSAVFILFITYSIGIIFFKFILEVPPVDIDIFEIKGDRFVDMIIFGTNNELKIDIIKPDKEIIQRKKSEHLALLKNMDLCKHLKKSNLKRNRKLSIKCIPTTNTGG